MRGLGEGEGHSGENRPCNGVKSCRSQFWSPPRGFNLLGSLPERLAALTMFAQLPPQLPKRSLERPVVLQYLLVVLCQLIQTLLKSGDFPLHTLFHQSHHCLHGNRCGRRRWHGKTAIKSRAVNTALLSQSTFNFHFDSAFTFSCFSPSGPCTLF